MGGDIADDERFAAWRAAAARHGRILVITGSQGCRITAHRV